MGLIFKGLYDEVREREFLSYKLGEGRKVVIAFTDNGKTTTVSEMFDPEKENPVEMQRQGWQAIMNNFKKYVESKNR